MRTEIKSTNKLQAIQQWRGRRALFFDTETSGLPRSGGLDRQPHVIQLAWTFGQLPQVGDAFQVQAKSSLLIDLPSGATIDPGASNVHGIDGETVDLFGVSRSPAIQLFASYMAMSDVVIGHNIPFDLDRIWDEYRREPLLAEVVASGHGHIDRECTMQLTRDICQIPPTAKMVRAGRNHYKSPQLGESFLKLFGRELEDAHDALVDVEACQAIFLHLLDLGAADASKRSGAFPKVDAEELIDG